MASILTHEDGYINESKIKIIRRDFKNIRDVRQINNNNLVLHAINNDEQDEFYNSINKNELDRHLKYMEIDFDTFWNKCKND